MWPAPCLSGSPAGSPVSADLRVLALPVLLPPWPRGREILATPLGGQLQDQTSGPQAGPGTGLVRAALHGCRASASAWALGTFPQVASPPALWAEEVRARISASARRPGAHKAALTPAPRPLPTAAATFRRKCCVPAVPCSRPEAGVDSGLAWTTPLVWTLGPMWWAGGGLSSPYFVLLTTGVNKPFMFGRGDSLGPVGSSW